MAVETLYRSTLDLETYFVEKKLADQHDAMLELGEALTAALIQNVAGLDESLGEEVGIFMAKNRSAFASAFKNNPGALLEIGREAEE